MQLMRSINQFSFDAAPTLHQSYTLAVNDVKHEAINRAYLRAGGGHTRAGRGGGERDGGGGEVRDELLRRQPTALRRRTRVY